MITRSQLKEALKYSASTGIFTWNKKEDKPNTKHYKSNSTKTFNSKFSGKEAGSISKTTDGKSYLKISINGCKYYAHRLAWLYIYGDMPKGMIDHISGDGLDNSILNIRDVNGFCNMKNMKKSKANTSGTTGVYFDKRRGRWTAAITVNLKEVFLGSFCNINDAIAARSIANKDYKFHSNHGSTRKL
tara:strand:- start:77 stop:637 length:561 start_codon:yes stop_codon:yes gene_type:complete